MEIIFCQKIRSILSISQSPKILEHVWVDGNTFFSTVTKFTYLDSRVQPEKIKHFFLGYRNNFRSKDSFNTIKIPTSENVWACLGRWIFFFNHDEVRLFGFETSTLAPEIHQTFFSGLWKRLSAIRFVWYYLNPYRQKF